MVLDLRNNGGGHVISSNMLSTCIAGAACQGKVYEYYRYNDSRMATVEKTERETGKEYDTAAKKFFDEFYYGDYYGVDLRNYALNMTGCTCSSRATRPRRAKPSSIRCAGWTASR